MMMETKEWKPPPVWGPAAGGFIDVENDLAISPTKQYVPMPVVDGEFDAYFVRPRTNIYHNLDYGMHYDDEESGSHLVEMLQQRLMDEEGPHGGPAHIL